MARRNRLPLILVLVALPSAPCLGQAVLHVDATNCPGPGSGSPGDPFCSVQSGIDAAQHGDEVRVAAGTYPERLDLSGKRIHLRAPGGPEVTTLDAQGTGSVITCTSGETLETIVEGFTIRNGPGTLSTHCTGQGQLEGVFGGGILVFGSAITIRDCAFINNGNDAAAEILGGGAIYVEDGDAVVEDCYFEDNTIVGDGTGYGASAAICGFNGSLTVLDSVFESNGRSGLAGGGVFSYGTNVTVERCTFIDNKAAFGGGVFAFPGRIDAPTTAIVRDSTFLKNDASGGGGLFVWAVDGATAEVSGSLFRGNYGSGGGGATVRTDNFSAASVDNCVFDDNEGATGGGLEVSATQDSLLVIRQSLFCGNRAVGVGTGVVGGGIAVLTNSGSRTDIVNCTLVENSADFSGGGLDANGAPINFVNGIIYDNFPNSYSGNPAVSFSDVQGGAPGPGNFDGDPRFVDQAARDFRFLPHSRCIDSGSNAASGGIVHDLAGQPRFVDYPEANGISPEPVVDMGPYEFPHGNLLRFQADGDTMTWFPVGGASFYNMYRGALADLVDGDGDGLPDNGYGGCVNGLDPDTSDREFVDTAVPDPSEGLFYVFSSVDHGGTEIYLGTTSAGRPRQVLVPCP